MEVVALNQRVGGTLVQPLGGESQLALLFFCEILRFLTCQHVKPTLTASKARHANMGGKCIKIEILWLRSVKAVTLLRSNTVE